MSNATLTKPTTVLLGALAGLVVSGLLVFNGLSTQGHAAFNTNNLGISWGLAIVVYDYFLLTSTGLAMVAAISLVFGARDFAVVAKRCVWLSLAGLVGGVAVLALELGQPLRAIWAIPLNLQTSAPLFWKVLFVAAHVILLLALFAKLSRPGWTPESVRGTALLSLVAALGVTVVVDETEFISTPSYYMDWVEGGALVANPPWEDDTRTGAYGAGSLGTAEKGGIWLHAAIEEKARHVDEIHQQFELRTSRRHQLS